MNIHNIYTPNQVSKVLGNLSRITLPFWKVCVISQILHWLDWNRQWWSKDIYYLHTMLWHANSKVHILAKNCEGQKTKAFKCLLGKLQQKLRLLQECAKKKQKYFSLFFGGFSTVFFKLLSNTCWATYFSFNYLTKRPLQKRAIQA